MPPMTARLNIPSSGETVAWAELPSGALLVAGLAPAEPGSVGILTVAPGSRQPGRMLMRWPRRGAPADAASGFMAIVAAPGTGPGSRGLVLQAGPKSLSYGLAPRSSGIGTLLSAVLQEAPEAFAPIRDEFVEAALTGPADPDEARLATEALGCIPDRAGFIEVIGRADTGDIYLQGWASGFRHRPCRVLLVDEDGLFPADFLPVSMRRDDLGEGAAGFCGLMRPMRSIEPGAVAGVYLRRDEGWIAVEAYGERRILSALEVPGQVRDTLPSASGDADALARLMAVAARFDGRDTVNSLPAPVRLGIDLVLQAAGSGLLVTGWLLDPTRSVRSIVVHAGEGAHDLLAAAMRHARADVTMAFRADPAFEPVLDPDRHGHGFLAFLPGLKSDGALYAEVVLADGSVGFQALRSPQACTRRELRRLLAGITPAQAADPALVERHLGPLVRALDPETPRLAGARDMGFRDGPTALVLLGVPAAELPVSLSLLALDPDASRLPCIVALTAEDAEAGTEEVARLAAFHGTALRLVSVEGARDACDLLEAAAEATEAETIVALTCGTYPAEPGWLARLERAYRARAGRAMVSPSILFEDGSIRYAGTVLEGEDGRRRLVDRLAGFPPTLAALDEAGEVAAGTLSCAILPRRALLQAGEGRKAWLGTGQKARDLSLRLRLAGTSCIHLPEVRMLQAGADGDEPGPMGLAEEVDQWCFENRWSLALTNLRI
jgi:hypothetical protein